MSEDSKNKLLSRQEELMYGFQFSDEDLGANREGCFTECQREIVLAHGRLQWLFYHGAGIFGVLFFGLATILFILTIFGSPRREWFFILLAIALTSFGIVGSIHVLKLGPKSRKTLLQDLDEGVAKSIQGLAVVDAGDTRGAATITVNEVKFTAPRDAILRVKHLEPHIFYYLLRSKVILSVEVVEPA
jgi:hypothetical protein